jgi:hypothetical protein
MDIFERDEHGLFTRQLSEDAEETSRDGARLRWISLRLGEEECALERASLRTRQAGQQLGDAWLEEISERRMRQIGLCRHGLRREDEVGIGSSDDCASPQGRFPDPGLALQHESCRELVVCLEEAGEVRQFLLSADDSRGAAAG